MKYKYRIESWAEGEFDEVESCFGIEDGYLEYVAEEAAEHFYNNHDGSEYLETGLPDITIYTMEGQKLGTFEVAVDFSPYFSAYPKE